MVAVTQQNKGRLPHVCVSGFGFLPKLRASLPPGTVPTIVSKGTCDLTCGTEAQLSCEELETS